MARGFLALTTLLASAALCQEFEVASVKPNNTGSNNAVSNTAQNRFTATNVSLKKLIVRAYGLNDYQVKGPDWLASTKFDIAAKFPETLPKDKLERQAFILAAMQHLLANRFKLTVHREQKISPVLGLTIAKSGIQFKQVPDSDSHNSQSRNNNYTGTCISMEELAKFLSGQTDFPVVDMTGLKGFYDLTLNWAPDTAKPGEIASLPALPEAIQEQLGLKFESRKAPIDFLVVDHAEKVPTEN